MDCKGAGASPPLNPKAQTLNPKPYDLERTSRSARVGKLQERRKKHTAATNNTRAVTGSSLKNALNWVAFHGA